MEFDVKKLKFFECDCPQDHEGSNTTSLSAPSWSRTMLGDPKPVISVDSCLADEIINLWEEGVKTNGCCCGHNVLEGFIGVSDSSVDKMLDLGYEMIRIKGYPIGHFYPKSLKPRNEEKSVSVKKYKDYLRLKDVIVSGIGEGLRSFVGEGPKPDLGMQGLKLVKVTRDWLNHIEEHLLNVEKAFREVEVKCKDMRVIYNDYYYHLLRQDVINHDLSKFSKEEFTAYRGHFFQVAGFDTKWLNGSFSDAWEHHKKHNPHHWENWTKKKYYEPNLWEVDAMHMVIDWLAMSYRIGDTPRAYYEKNKDKIKLPDYGIDFIYDVFKRLEVD